MLSILIHEFPPLVSTSFLKKTQGPFAILLFSAFAQLSPLSYSQSLSYLTNLSPSTALIVCSFINLSPHFTPKIIRSYFTFLLAPPAFLNVSFHSHKWFMLIWNSFPEWGHPFPRVISHVFSGRSLIYLLMSFLSQALWSPISDLRTSPLWCASLTQINQLKTKRLFLMSFPASYFLPNIVCFPHSSSF